MALILLFALVLAVAAIALALHAAVLPRLRAGESLGQIDAYGFAGEAVADAPKAAGFLPELAASVGNLVRGRRAEARQEEMRKLLLSAGAYRITPTAFIGYRVLAGVVVGGFVFVSSLGGSPALMLGGSLYAGFIGWMAPLFLLKSRARRRMERIELELPELIDLLVVSLEAGLGFTAALQRSAERMRGPLADELRLVLREQSLGLTTEQALLGILERGDAPAMRSFVRRIVQGEAMGVSVAQVMRDLAGDLRTRRRQIIEEKAQKAPIKILFPLAFLLLPAMFVVLLFPGLHKIFETLGGG